MIDKPWRDAISVAVNRRDADGGKMLAKVAESVVIAAINGDMSAAKEIGDRLDGKAPQAITNADGGPLTVQILRLAHGVDPAS